MAETSKTRYSQSQLISHNQQKPATDMAVGVYLCIRELWCIHGVVCFAGANVAIVTTHTWVEGDHVVIMCMNTSHVNCHFSVLYEHGDIVTYLALVLSLSLSLSLVQHHYIMRCYNIISGTPITEFRWCCSDAIMPVVLMLMTMSGAWHYHPGEHLYWQAKIEVSIE